MEAKRMEAAVNKAAEYINRLTINSKCSGEGAEKHGTVFLMGQ